MRIFLCRGYCGGKALREKLDDSVPAVPARDGEFHNAPCEPGSFAFHHPRYAGAWHLCQSLWECDPGVRLRGDDRRRKQLNLYAAFYVYAPLDLRPLFHDAGSSQPLVFGAFHRRNRDFSIQYHARNWWFHAADQSFRHAVARNL